MKRTLSDAGIERLKPRDKRYHFSDPEMNGLFIRVLPSGQKAFAAVARDGGTKRQVWATVGSADLMSIEEAREKAREVIRRIKEGKTAFAPPPPKAASFEDIANQWVRRHVRANKLRSQYELERVLSRYIVPRWGGRDLASLRRSDVVQLLDTIEDEHGPRQADMALAVVGNIFNWFAVRDDVFRSPIVKGMRRSNSAERRRSRVLDDDEVRAVWRHAEKAGTYGAFIRLALLTGQRKTALAGMRWDDIVNGEWRIPQEARAKGTGGTLKLPDMALAIIEQQPRLASNPHVMPAQSGNGPIAGFSQRKREFDREVPIKAWTIHDLRRSSRSLMSRAGVRPDICERVLGHAITGVAGIYDRFGYDAEKGAALAALAKLIESILSPPEGANVVRLPMRDVR